MTEIRYSQLEDRFDSEYYKPEYLEVETILKNKKNVFSIKEIKKGIQHPQEFKREYAKSGGIPFLRVSNIKNGYIDSSDVEFVYLDSGAVGNIIHEGDILITRSGTVGLPVIVTKEFDDCVISADFLLLKLKREVKNLKINPYYIFVFLFSKFGFYQSQRNLIGAVQKHINTEGLGSIKIPIPPKQFQQKIEKLVKEGFSKRSVANQKYEQAKQLLEKELGLDKLELKEVKTFEVNFSELFESGRFDVEFNKPMYSKINELLEKNEKKKIFVIKRLKEIGNLSKGIEIGSDAYASEGYLFLRVSNLSEKEITIGPSSQFVRPYLYGQLKSKYKPEIGDVLYTKDATIGVSFVIDKDFDEFIPSGGIVRIKPKEVDPYYLALLLNSVICKSQSDRKSIGAVIKHFTFENLKNLKVPLIPKAKQEQISTLIRESFSLRKKSKILLDKAKEEVEEMIENGIRK